MAARPTMAGLITRLRALIGDTGETPVFTDDELQTVLDLYQYTVRYMELEGEPVRTPTGHIEYYTFHSRDRFWEDDVQVVTGGYVAVPPTSAEPLAGRFTWETPQDRPLYIVGKRYDVYSAAVDLLEEWIGRIKGGYDFSSNGRSYQRSQRIEHLEKLLQRYERQIPLRTSTLVRTDERIGS